MRFFNNQRESKYFFLLIFTKDRSVYRRTLCVKNILSLMKCFENPNKNLGENKRERKSYSLTHAIYRSLVNPTKFLSWGHQNLVMKWLRTFKSGLMIGFVDKKYLKGQGRHATCKTAAEYST